MKLEVGMLALVVGVANPANSMLIVELVSFEGDITSLHYGLVRACWFVKTRGRNILMPDGRKVESAYLAAEYLRPISGLPDEVEQLDEATA
jgi:hypothetical protein